MMAYCGLICTECSIYQATRADDLDQRIRTAKAFSTPEIVLSESDIHCLGCTSNGSLYVGCNDCHVRKCARDKEIEHCGACTSYPCSLLDIPFAYDPECRERLSRTSQLSVPDRQM